MTSHRLWIPARLRPGDRVAIVAPSGPVDPVRLARGRQVLTEIGLDVVVMPRVLNRRGYLAGSDAGRAADLQEAWCDPEVRAVICARGGYGATRLLDPAGAAGVGAQQAAGDRPGADEPVDGDGAEP
ncbi:LD-carboxypeptidase, partial [Sphaerisporangium sp. NPDC049002]|uniref:LD-carboxypeptidase n=1 Tax=Sphaerisporangium sp. NPDC049002 TaxID=3155392 RepID=UPI003403A69C